MQKTKRLFLTIVSTNAFLFVYLKEQKMEKLNKKLKRTFYSFMVCVVIGCVAITFSTINVLCGITSAGIPTQEGRVIAVIDLFIVVLSFVRAYILYLKYIRMLKVKRLYNNTKREKFKNKMIELDYAEVDESVEKYIFNKTVTALSKMN